MQSIYEVPVIPNNLRHEETVVQIADVLNFLCNVYEDILTKVNNRIEDNKGRLAGLVQRVNNSADKVQKLTGTKKATQVFSSSKYPAADIHKRYKSVFVKTNGKSMKLERTKVKFKNSIISEQPFEKLQFYHVKIGDKVKDELNFMGVEGLGAFPNDVELINELLLFNTSKNPYKNYVMSDPLQATQHTREPEETSTAPGPDAAPLSITQRSALNRSVGENYFYSPGLGDVPIIDVPLDLPDLPGVADDLRYLMESGPGIAPSVTTTPVAPELPQITSPSVDLRVEDHQVEAQMPLPLLPLAIPIVEEVPQIIEEPRVVVPVVKKVPVPEEPVSTQDLNPLPVIEDTHASLMAAIRQAGGVKKANLRNTDQKNEDKMLTPSNNLMADLNAKLALRRKGISGTKMSEESEMTSALSRISAMIPPPSVNSDLTESANTEDEDWEE